MSISYTLTVFRELIETHPTWDSLRDYLTSPEGGLLTVGPYKDNLVIIHYNKAASNFTIPHVRWFRSVIWDTIQHRPVSVASPKCSPEDPLTWSQIDQSYTITEYIDGVTFNAYTLPGKDLQIATRTRFNADGKYYSDKTFAELIVNVITNNGHDQYDSYQDTINYLQRTYNEPSEEDVSTFACMVLKHIDHRVVEQLQTSNLHYIHSGAVKKNGDVIISEQNIQQIKHPEESVTVKQWYEELAASKSWQWRGVVIRDGKGNRWRICSPVYRMIRSLRGGTPRKDERFFNLRRQGLVKTYLAYYPEDKEAYWIYETWMRGATRKLFDLYCQVNKAHTLAYNDIESQWKAHVSGLHAHYMSSLKPAGKTVAFENVIQYMNSLETPRLLFLMNYGKHAKIEETVN